MMQGRFELSNGEEVFRVLNYSVLLLLMLVTLYPLWYVLQASFTDPVERLSIFWPRGFY